MSALAFDAESSGGVTGTSLTIAHTCTGANLILLAGVQIESASDLVTGITYNGVSMTRIAAEVNGSGNETVYLYYLIAPATGTNNIVVSTSSSVAMQGSCASYTGAQQSAQPGSFNASTNTASASITGTTTVVFTNCWLVGYFGWDDGVTLTAGAGTTLRALDGASRRGLADSNAAVGTGSQSLIGNWNSGSGSATVVIASILGTDSVSATTPSTSTSSSTSTTTTSTSTSTTRSTSTSTTTTSTSTTTTSTSTTTISTSTTTTSTSTSISTSTSTSTTTTFFLPFYISQIDMMFDVGQA